MRVGPRLETAPLPAGRYLRGWIYALRPLSLIIAVVSCLTGIVTAYREGYGNTLTAVLVLTGGIFLQSGVNLINDFFEFRARNIRDKIPHLDITGTAREKLEVMIFLTGVGFFLLTVPIGIFLVFTTGLPLLFLGAVGLFGGYFYTAEPLNYKRRGLAVIFVFFLMGVLMIAGAYYAVSGRLSPDVLFLSLPVSALVSQLLLSNEIRDYEYDLEYGHRTLTYRIGFKKAVALYGGLLLFAYLFPIHLDRVGILSHAWILAGALPLAAVPLRTLFRPPADRVRVIPWNMLHHAVYGGLYIVATSGVL
jgi:1,4-dihydroxy-2-naphthoate octaprenyltransferase